HPPAVVVRPRGVGVGRVGHAEAGAESPGRRATSPRPSQATVAGAPLRPRPRLSRRPAAWPSAMRKRDRPRLARRIRRLAYGCRASSDSWLMRAAKNGGVLYSGASVRCRTLTSTRAQSALIAAIPRRRMISGNRELLAWALSGKRSGIVMHEERHQTTIFIGLD